MPWEFRSDLPIYTQLIAQIQQRIITGQLQPGDRLPSVRDWAAEAGVNPNTMQRAMTEMERQGLARTQVRDFLAAMGQLGFGPDEIASLIQKEGENSL